MCSELLKSLFSNLRGAGNLESTSLQDYLTRWTHFYHWLWIDLEEFLHLTNAHIFPPEGNLTPNNHIPLKKILLLSLYLVPQFVIRRLFTHLLAMPLIWALSQLPVEFQPRFFKCKVRLFYHCRCPCSSWVLHKLNSFPTFSKNLINKPPNFFQQGRILILIADILFCIIWKIGVRIKIPFEQFWQKVFEKSSFFKNTSVLSLSGNPSKILEWSNILENHLMLH